MLSFCSVFCSFCTYQVKFDNNYVLRGTVGEFSQMDLNGKFEPVVQ